MTITNPGAIPNSGSKKFTAQLAQVALINYNRNLNDEEYNAFVNATWYANYSRAGSMNTSIPNNTFGNLQTSNLQTGNLQTGSTNNPIIQQNFITEHNLVHECSCKKKKKDKKKYKKCY